MPICLPTDVETCSHLERRPPPTQLSFFTTSIYGVHWIETTTVESVAQLSSSPKLFKLHRTRIYDLNKIVKIKYDQYISVFHMSQHESWNSRAHIRTSQIYKICTKPTILRMPLGHTTSWHSDIPTRSLNCKCRTPHLCIDY